MYLVLSKIAHNATELSRISFVSQKLHWKLRNEMSRTFPGFMKYFFTDEVDKITNFHNKDIYFTYTIDIKNLRTRTET